jgi:hypothetical protein
MSECYHHAFFSRYRNFQETYRYNEASLRTPRDVLYHGLEPKHLLSGCATSNAKAADLDSQLLATFQAHQQGVEECDFRHFDFLPPTAQVACMFSAIRIVAGSRTRVWVVDLESL